MPYKRRYKRRANGAEDKVARVAKYKKSAKAQSKQIVSLAKSVNVIKHTLKDHTVPVMWENNLIETVALRNQILGGNSAPIVPNSKQERKNSNVLVFPLTSVGNPEFGAYPSTNDRNASPSLVGGSSHIPVQPYGRAIGQESNNSAIGASWMKLYNQKVHMCLRANDTGVPMRYKIYVVRLAKPEDGSSLDSQFLATRRNIDGDLFKGCPNTLTSFELDADYYASDGWNPPSSGSPGAIDEHGSALASVNKNRFFVESSRTVTLGPQPRVNTSTSAVIAPVSASSLATPHARDYYETTFKISYGGVKVAAPNEQEQNVPLRDRTQTIMDVKYENLRSDILRWLVIFPDTNLTAQGTDLGAPVITLRSQISSRCPA